MMRYFFTVAVLVLATINAHAMTVGEYRSAHDSPETRAYLQGIVDGIADFSSWASGMKDQKPLICLPEGLEITGSQAQSVVDAALERIHPMSGANIATPLWSSLTRMFPCH